MRISTKYRVANVVGIATLGTMLGACGGPKSEQAAIPVTTPAPQVAPASTWEPPPLPVDDPKGAIAMLGLTGPDKPWPSMSHEEKEWYMIGKVHPIMRQVFETFDKNRYAGEKFECTPCHDPNVELTKYKMPNAKLSPVPAVDSADWKAMENARVVKFMKARVTPVMAQLLGYDPDDASKGDAVTCYACHPKS